MSYDIFSPIAPKMPKLGKGTHTLTLALSQTSAEMREPIAAMIIPVMASLITGVKFKYSDNNFYETCGQMGHLIGPSGIGKAQFTRLVEAVMRSFRQHDETEFQKLVDWQRQMKTKGANKEKPERPDVAFWYPPADMTNAAFLQNSMALEKLGGRTQFVNLPEVEMADRMFGGHRQVSQMVRNIYDQQRAGALRATAEGVTGNPVLRVNITFTSTPEVARQFYKKDLTNGFFGRIPFAYKERGERCGRIPRQGSYGDDFLTKLDACLLRLTNCKGSFTIKPLNKLADQLAEEMAKLGDMTDDDMLLGPLPPQRLLGLEEGGCALDTQRPNVDEVYRRNGGVVLLLRPMVQSEGLRRHVWPGRNTHGTGATRRREEYAGGLARDV